MSSEQTVTKVTKENNKDVRVHLSCGHSYIEFLLPYYSPQAFHSRMQRLIGTKSECPTCEAEAFVSEED